MTRQNYLSFVPVDLQNIGELAYQEKIAVHTKEIPASVKRQMFFEKGRKILPFIGSERAKQLVFDGSPWVAGFEYFSPKEYFMDLPKFRTNTEIRYSVQYRIQEFWCSSGLVWFKPKLFGFSRVMFLSEEIKSAFTDEPFTGFFY